MKKRKEDMQDQAASKNWGTNQLSGGELEKTSGGEAEAYKATFSDEWNVDLGKDFLAFKAGKNERYAKNVANEINVAIANGKFHDMRDKPTNW